jgi:hypothetical protein
VNEFILCMCFALICKPFYLDTKSRVQGIENRLELEHRRAWEGVGWADVKIQLSFLNIIYGSFSFTAISVLVSILDFFCVGIFAWQHNFYFCMCIITRSKANMAPICGKINVL